MAKMKVLSMNVGVMQRPLLITLVLLASAMLTACGGGGGGGGSDVSPANGSSSPQNVGTTPPVPATTEEPEISAADLDLATRLYKGDERTPDGFDVEARPANVVGTLSTRHLRNSDFGAGQQAIGGSVYEMCTNDEAEAMEWSERLATWQGQYSDMVEIRSDNRMFEVVRVPRADVTAMIRHRVFRCDYLDRSGSDLRTDAGSAGSMNQRPLTADELEALSEYLWQFTMFNNADYAVESSTSGMQNGTLVHTIRLGQLVRGSNGACDMVQVSDWTHTMDAGDGTMTRSLTPVRSFQVQTTSSGTQTCSD